MNEFQTPPRPYVRLCRAYTHAWTRVLYHRDYSTQNLSSTDQRFCVVTYLGLGLYICRKKHIGTPWPTDHFVYIIEISVYNFFHSKLSFFIWLMSDYSIRSYHISILARHHSLGISRTHIYIYIYEVFDCHRVVYVSVFFVSRIYRYSRIHVCCCAKVENEAIMCAFDQPIWRVSSTTRQSVKNRRRWWRWSWYI